MNTIPVITSNNEVRLTGLVNAVRHEDVQGHLLVHLEICTVTRFLRLSGRVEEKMSTHKAVAWQRHLDKPVLNIKAGDIIKLSGELQNQPWVNRYGKWTTMPTVFVTDFEILAENGRLGVQESRAKIYDE